MTHANDNDRGELWFSDAWTILEEAPFLFELGFERELRKKLPATLLCYSAARSLDNFLWFVKFNYSWREYEIEEKRNSIKEIR